MLNSGLKDCNKIKRMKPYLNLALLSLDWLDHGRERYSQNKPGEDLYNQPLNTFQGEYCTHIDDI